MYLQIIFFIIYFLSVIEISLNTRKEKEHNNMMRKQLLIFSLCVISIITICIFNNN